MDFDEGPFTAENAGLSADWVRDGFPLSFGQVEAVLARFVEVAEDRRAAFVSRLKQWQKLGFPELPRPGQGARIDYSVEHVFQLAVLVDLLRLGLTPDRCIRYIRQSWPTLRGGFIDAISHTAGGSAELFYAMIHVDALHELQGLDWASGAHVDIVRDSDLSDLWRRADEQLADSGRVQRAIDDGYSLDVWREALRRKIAGSIVVELNDISAKLLHGIRMVTGRTLDCFSREFGRWQDEHALWLFKGGGYAKDGDINTLKLMTHLRSTRRKGYRERFQFQAHGQASAFIGRGEIADVDPEA